jgi:peptidoglycan hydrolase-like protein with peptidoglycan-binding domain
MRKLISLFSVVALIVVAGVSAPAASFAQTTTVSSSVQTQINLIASLTAQIQALQAQIASLAQQQQTATASLVSTLSLGSQGDQVSILQALLAADPSIYPEGLITGYYGNATARAVKRFQAENGITQVGTVGPKTLKALNDALDKNPIEIEDSTSTATSTASGDHGDGHGRPCAIVPPGHLIAPGWLRKNGGVAPIVPACQTVPPGIGDHNRTSTPSSTIVLSLSNIATGVTSSSATISWNTNVGANSQVMYGPTNLYGSNTTLDASLVTAHSQTITGLAASTTYHFEVVSVDSYGTATSSDMTFTTAASTTADTTPPVITVGTSTLASTTATLSWTTNEAATGKVFYGTVNPLDLTATSTLSISAPTLSTGESVQLTGLTASTTYYFVIQATDASANVATTSQMSFVTTAQ